MAWPWNKQGIASPNLNVKPQQRDYFSGQAEIFQPDRNLMNQVPSYTPYTNYLNYEDLIQNPEHMPNRLQNLERFQDNRFTGDDNEVPGMGKKAIDYIDSPVNFMKRQNHPRRFDPLVNAKNFTQELPGNIKNKLVNFKDSLSGGLKNIFDNTLIGKFAAMNDATNPNAFNYNPQLQGQIDFLESKNAHGVMDQSGLNKITQGALRGKNLQSMFGTNDLTTMYDNQIAKLDKTLANLEDQGWSAEDFARKQALFTKRKNDAILEREQVLAQQKKIADERAAVQQRAGAAANQMTQRREGRGGTHMSRSIDRGGLGISQSQAQAVSDANRAAGMGGWGLAQGGRAGYANGDMVAQETDFIEGPQGGEEFQETVVEGQEQPSREQLEALAWKIFNLPVEELDDQQLVVVYQEAMQGQPMEENVQEDVQFAAQGGLAGLL